MSVKGLRFTVEGLGLRDKDVGLRGTDLAFGVQVVSENPLDFRKGARLNAIERAIRIPIIRLRRAPPHVNRHVRIDS